MPDIDELSTYSECLLICSRHFSDETDWDKLEMNVTLQVSVIWMSSHGHPFEITDEAQLMFMFVGEAARWQGQPGVSLLPMPVEEFSNKVSPVVLSLGSRNAYRRLLAHASPSLAKRLLLNANDIAALYAFKPKRQEYVAARKHDFFDRLMLRSDEQRFTLISLQMLLDEGAEQQGVSIRRLHADLDVGPDTKLEVGFSFDGLLGQTAPINVVIGPNGAGKTRMLLGIAAQALKEELHIDGEEVDQYHDTRSSTRCPTIAAFTYESRHWSGLKRRGVRVTPLGISTANWRSLSGTIRQIAGDSHGGEFELRALLQIMQKIVDIRDVFLPAMLDNGETDFVEGKPAISLFQLAERPDHMLISNIDISRPLIIHNEQRGTYELSSGQKSLCYFCAALFLHVRPGSLLLVDEPENHLHPQFITLLMQTLASSLIAKEAKAIVVTHSPFVVREVERNAVLVLQNGPDGLPCTYRPSLQTFGADVALISDYVFGDTAIKKGYEALIDEAVGERRQGLSEEMRRSLNETLGSDAMNYFRKKYWDSTDA